LTYGERGKVFCGQNPLRGAGRRRCPASKNSPGRGPGQSCMGHLRGEEAPARHDPTPGRRTALSRPRRRGLGAAEPFEDGDLVHDPPAVLGLDPARGAAPRAHQIARQGFRSDDADMAARARDPDHHRRRRERHRRALVKRPTRKNPARTGAVAFTVSAGADLHPRGMILRSGVGGVEREQVLEDRRGQKLAQSLWVNFAEAGFRN
jgi:hypothetical protein